MRVEQLSETFGLLATPTKHKETLATVESSWIHQRLGEVRGGLILFRGFDVTEATFQAFTDAHGRRFLVHHNVEGRDYLGQDRSLATVAKSQRPIDFHLEMASNPVKPKVLWFYCVAPALRMGRIGFADGQAVLRQLTGRTKQRLSEGLLYQFQDLPEETWRPVWEAAIPGSQGEPGQTLRRGAHLVGRRAGVTALNLDDERRLSFSYQVPCIYPSAFSGEQVCASGLLDNHHRTFLANGEPIPQDVVIEVAQATYQNAVWVDWTPGDVAVIDNTRVMHAREAFEDSQRRVLVRYSTGMRRIPVSKAAPSVSQSA